MAIQTLIDKNSAATRTAFPRLLLVTDVLPPNDLCHGAFLQRLCSLIPEGKLACFALSDGLKRPEPDSLQDSVWSIPHKIWQRAAQADSDSIRSSALSRFLQNKIDRLRKVSAEDIADRERLSDMIAQAAVFGEQFGAEKLWCVLQSKKMIDLAPLLASRMRKPLLTQICQAPESWLRQNGMAAKEQRKILDSLATTLRSSERCAASSLPMANTYRREAGCEVATLSFGLDNRLALPSAEGVHDGDTVIIGIASELHAQWEWKSFLQMLDKVNWRVGNRKVLVRVIGRTFNCCADRPRRLEYLGFRSIPETITLLSECDVLFDADYFDRLFEREVRHASLSRLAVYLASGRPVVYHGPEYSPLSQLLKSYSAGIICNTAADGTACAAVDIYNGIDRLIFDSEHYRTVTGNGTKAFLDNLAADKLHSELCNFLGV